VQSLGVTADFTICRPPVRFGAINFGQGLDIARLTVAGWIALLAAIPAWCANGDYTNFPAVGAGTPNFTGSPGMAPQAAGAPGRDWAISIRTVESLTWTDNVFLAPAGQEKADMVLGLALPLGLRHDSARAKLWVDYTPTYYLYANSREFNNLQNNLHSLLTVAPVENFFFVDAIANMEQSYISPSGPRPVSGSSITDNRTQQTVLGLSPYIRRENDAGWSYLVRNDNFWTTYSGGDFNGVPLADSTSNRFLVDAKSGPALVRYGFDYTYERVRDESLPTAHYQQIGRVRPILAVTPRINLSARLGYESNDYVNSYSGKVYGAGLDWMPTPRTKLDSFIEHRFFGASYGLKFNHRTRLTAWNLSASRDTYIGTDQPFQLQPGTTAQVLNDALRSQIADPAQRQQAVQQLMQRAGLPPSLTQPYSFYTNQIYRSQQVTGSFGLVGKRNTASLTFLWQDNVPITTGGDILPAGVVATTSFRQRGVTLAFSHRLSGFSNVTLSADRVYATQSSTSGAVVQSDSVQDTMRLSLTRQLSPHTDASIGLRWANFDAIASPYRELALIAVLGHSF